MKRLFFCLVLNGLLVVGSSFAQEEVDTNRDLNELEDSLDTDSRMVPDEQTSSNPVEQIEPESAQAQPSEAVPAESSASAEAQGEGLENSSETAAEDQTAQAPEDEGIPQDILELEASFEKGEALPSNKDILVSEQDKGGASGKTFQELTQDPGSQLAPSEKFARIPLRPQMSDRSWLRYAGAQHEKVYRIKKGDSLWVVSERLFGNPHLWPKVWQLNANLGNAHVLESGRELLFTPGNPNSAPLLAFRQIPGRQDQFLPALTGHLTSGGITEKISQALLDTGSGVNRFRSFLVKNEPEVLGKIPKQDRPGNKIVFGKGDVFHLPEVPSGVYSIVRLGEPKNKGPRAKVLWWLGSIRVRDPIKEDDLNAEIIESFESISPGDIIAERSFAKEPLALRTEVLGPERRDEVRLLNIDSNLITLSAEDHLIGAKFKNEAVGPTVGSIVNLYRSKDWVASAVLIDRDQDVGTFWVVESKSEVLPTDYIE